MTIMCLSLICGHRSIEAVKWIRTYNSDWRILPKLSCSLMRPVLTVKD